MENLRDLPNVGRVLEELLVRAGLDTPEKLRAVGVCEAFIRVRMIDPTACHAMLYGIAGAIMGVRHHDLTVEKKMS